MVWNRLVPGIPIVTSSDYNFYSKLSRPKMTNPPASSWPPDPGNIQTLFHNCIHILECDFNACFIFEVEKEVFDLVPHTILCVYVTCPINNTISFNDFIYSQCSACDSVIELICPIPVSLYLCLPLEGLSGIVISTTSASITGVR